MRKTLFIFFVFLIISGNAVSAQEIGVGEAEVVSEEVYTFPVIKPTGNIFGGYRLVDYSGSERVEEYEYLHDSISLGGEGWAFPFPHRLHFEIDVKNRKDYFGDVGYSYKDIVLFRDINRTLFHNLENINLVDLNTSTSSPGVDVRDKDKEYGVRTGINDMFLRFKTPDFPFHVYFDGMTVKKDGTQQQRSLLGAGYFNSITRTSQSRDIDWQTTNYAIGTNSHLGPVEVDLSHREKRFDVNGDKVLYDTYSAAVAGSTTERASGTYPHNLIPELRGLSNTLKIHTSYSGKLVASATFSKTERKNEDSGARADYFMGSGGVTWMPITRLTFFVKYRHNERSIDNPDTATITDASNSSNTYTYQTKSSISSITDTVSGTVRYRPISKLTLRADYSFEDIRRENADEWGLTDSTRRNTVSLSADTRILKNLTFKAKYTHKEIDDPAYNTEPNHSDEGRLSVSFIPLPQINALLSYSIAQEKRDDLFYLDTEEAKNKDAKRDKFLGSITFLLLKNLSLTTSYAYMHNNVTQDIEYHDTSGNPKVDYGVPYKDIAHSYSANVNYMAKDNVNLNAGITHTLSKGAFYPSSQDLLEPTSVASFSDINVRETSYAVSGEYQLKHGLALRIDYRYSVFNDVLDNPYDDVEDGTAHIVLLTLSKRW